MRLVCATCAYNIQCIGTIASVRCNRTRKSDANKCTARASIDRCKTRAQRKYDAKTTILRGETILSFCVISSTVRDKPYARLHERQQQQQRHYNRRTPLTPPSTFPIDPALRGQSLSNRWNVELECVHTHTTASVVETIARARNSSKLTSQRKAQHAHRAFVLKTKTYAHGKCNPQRCA
jgi:hypothetical protein